MRTVLFLACLVSIISAATKGETKVDSMVYDEPTEWRIYSVGAPVLKFAIQNDLLWCATEGGVVTTNLKKSDLQKYPKLGTIPSTGITAMAVDRSGRIWIGGENGLAVKGDKDWKVFTKDNGLPSTAITALAVAENGDVWAGTSEGLTLYQNGAWKVFDTKAGLVSQKVTCLAVDTKGAVWIGTDKGISVFNGGKWATHSMKNGMSWNQTSAIGIDPRTNAVWVAVGEKDVNSFDGKEWSSYMEILSGITSIMVDTQSRVWFGSEAGLIKFNGDEWISDPNKLGIPAARIFHIFRDENGNFWFGMESGVLRFANPYPF